MSVRQLTVKEIVDETVAFYSKDPKGRRSLISDSYSSCVYFNPSGCMCAVGRCMDQNNPQVQKVKEHQEKLLPDATVADVIYTSFNTLYSPVEDNVTTIDDLLLPQYHGHSVDFWIDLQGLHDVSENWSEEGIRMIGIDRAEEIIQHYSAIEEANA